MRPPLWCPPRSLAMNRVYRVPNPDTSYSQPPKLLDRLRQVLRTKHYAYSTEQVYVQWARRYILFPDKRHPHCG